MKAKHYVAPKPIIKKTILKGSVKIPPKPEAILNLEGTADIKFLPTVEGKDSPKNDI